MTLPVEDAGHQALLPDAADATRADLVGTALGDLECDAIARHRRSDGSGGPQLFPPALSRYRGPQARQLLSPAVIARMPRRPRQAAPSLVGDPALQSEWPSPRVSHPSRDGGLQTQIATALRAELRKQSSLSARQDGSVSSPIANAPKPSSDGWRMRPPGRGYLVAAGRLYDPWPRARSKPFALTLVRDGPYLPYVEVASYEYFKGRPPDVGGAESQSAISKGRSRRLGDSTLTYTLDGIRRHSHGRREVQAEAIESRVTSKAEPVATWATPGSFGAHRPAGTSGPAMAAARVDRRGPSRSGVSRGPRADPRGCGADQVGGAIPKR